METDTPLQTDNEVPHLYYIINNLNFPQCNSDLNAPSELSSDFNLRKSKGKLFSFYNKLGGVIKGDRNMPEVHLAQKVPVPTANRAVAWNLI